MFNTEFGVFLWFGLRFRLQVRLDTRVPSVAERQKERFMQNKQPLSARWHLYSNISKSRFQM